MLYLEIFLGGQDFTEKLACFDPQGVAQEPDLLDIVGAKVLDMRLDIRGGVELETSAFEREEPVRAGHDATLGGTVGKEREGNAASNSMELPKIQRALPGLWTFLFRR